MGPMKYGIGEKILYHLKALDRAVNGQFQMPITCEVDPTNRCQLKCKWCIYKKTRAEKPFDINVGTYKHVILELYKHNCKSITFTGGGEPLLHPRISDMIEWALIHNMKVGIVTNGVALHRIEKFFSRLEFIRVSLDCSTSGRFQELKGKNKFSDVCHNIEKAVASPGVDVGLSMVHTEENEDQIEEFVTLGEILGVDYVQVKAAWQPENIEEQASKMNYAGVFVTERYSVLPKFRSSLTYLPCVIAGLCGQLAADGKLYFCCVHRGKDDFFVSDMNQQQSLKEAIIKRNSLELDPSKCGSCRYVNYAKVYEQVSHKKYTMLRHRDFI